MDQPVRQAGAAVEWANQTTLHPLGLIALLVLGIAMVMVPRRLAMVPMFLLACMIPSAQRLVIAELDFDLLRLMVLFGWMRVMLRGEAAGFRWRAADILMVAWALSGTAAYTMLHASTSAFVNRLGGSFDALGMYFLFRILIRDWPELINAIKWLCLIALPVMVAFAIESQTARNAFSAFGGVPAMTDVRDGRLRCQGAFSHPILAGCFWASLLPLFASLWFERSVPKWMVVGGVCSALAVVLACSSSTPVMSVIFIMIGGGMFLMRHWLGQIRWAVAAMLVLLHFSMNAPVWHLMARVDVVSGSTGWHRYYLVDQAINKWDEWAFIGTRTTAHWGPGMQDVTNHYLLEGVQGGLLTLMLFVAIIVAAFGSIGRMWKLAEAQGNRARTYLAWAIGVSLFVHCMNFLAVSYFGQIMMMWYFTLAMAVSLDPKSIGIPATAHASASLPMFRESPRQVTNWRHRPEAAPRS